MTTIMRFGKLVQIGAWIGEDKWHHQVLGDEYQEEASYDVEI